MSAAIPIGRSLNGFDESESVSTGSRVVTLEWKGYLRGTASDWMPTIAAALHAIRVECGRPNWDGHEAAAISGRSIEIAGSLLEALYVSVPGGTPPPDVIPEADGEICVSWTGDESRTLSISIGEHGKINFAAQFGRDGGMHAWQPIDTTSRSNLADSLEDLVRAVGRVFPPPTQTRAA